MATWAQLAAEMLRLGVRRAIEDRLVWGGLSPICGVDEAGRGALAGPVVAAAVVPDPGRSLPGIDDSKRLTHEARERLEPLVRDSALAWSVISVPPSEIDRSNILEATRRAMRGALESLDPTPALALIDAVRLPDPPCRCIAFVRADHLSYAVACASILAKVGRDRMMCELDRRHPQYGFAQHKGYGSVQHRSALLEYGPTPAHRLTFSGVTSPRSEGAA